ncbi:hypothetical protein BOTBODRAFT_111547, partial [Botryobasidium botryosum FD-172 SS1]
SSYPAWVSLACDYLAIMCSSVSSERAFSSANLTITKLRNRLKGDITEALQGAKHSSRNGKSIFKGHGDDEAALSSSDEEDKGLDLTILSLNLSDDEE